MSNNKDAAFRVIQYLLSEEPQLVLVRNGLLSALKDENMNKRFGENMALFEGKNVQAIFKSQPAPKYPMHKYDSIVQGEFTKAFKDVEQGTKDINTALRDANDAANKRIQEQKASGK
jgi:multiple sugar transport system substrate-binding protein